MALDGGVLMIGGLPPVTVRVAALLVAVLMEFVATQV